MFTIVEVADNKVVGIHLYHFREKADIAYNQIEYENKIVSVEQRDWSTWLPNGTVRFSGDDSFSLQMIEDTPLDRMPMSIEVQGGVVQEVHSPIPIEYEIDDKDIQE